MKEILVNYTTYNLWANKKLLAVVQGLDVALLDKEIKSSFPSLRKTAHHIYFAEEIWGGAVSEVCKKFSVGLSKWLGTYAAKGG